MSRGTAAPYYRVHRVRTHSRTICCQYFQLKKTALIITHIFTLRFTRFSEFYIFKLHNKTKKQFFYESLQTLVTTKQQQDLYFL